ncbi:MAG: hypothetical protein WC576_01530 [Candidatus Omnitrophota bacterium]
MRIKKSAVICLFILLLFHLINNYIWLRCDAFSFHKDVMTHLSSQLNIFYGARQVLDSGVSLSGKLLDIGALISQQTSLYFSPLFYSIGLAINLLAGNSVLATRLLSGILYLFILIISVFFIGRKLQDDLTGLQAAFLVSCACGIFGSSRMYGLDLALTAMVSLAILFLLLTSNLISRKYSFIFGLVAGISVALKAQGALFILGPFFYTLYAAFIARPQFRIRKFINLLFIVAIVYLITVFFYRQHLLLISHFINFFHNHMIVPSVSEAKFLSLGWFLFYLGVIKDSFSLPLTILFIVSLILTVKSRRKNGFTILFLWVAVPYVLFTFLSLKDESYFFPVFPAVALIIAIGVNSYGRKTRRVLWVMLFTVSLFNYLVLSYYGFRSGTIWQDFIPVKVAKFMAGSQWAHPPAENRYAIVALDFVNKIKGNEHYAGIIRIGIIEERYFKGDFVKCLAYFLKLHLPEAKIYLSCAGNWPFFLDAQFLSQADNFEYIIAFKECSSCGSPEFSGLKYFKLPESRQSKYDPGEVERLMQRFKEYTVLRKNFIGGSCMPVFLMSKRKLKPVNTPAAVCKPVTNLLSGKIIAIGPSRSWLVIRHRDTSGQYREETFYIGKGTTSYENILSVFDLKLNADVVVDYYTGRDNKKVILNMSVDNILEIPLFLIEKPSGNIRSKRLK